MGAHPYHYVVPDDDPPRALAALRQSVFERGEFFGAERHPHTPEEALAQAEETGTRSILDILMVHPTPEYFVASFVPDELVRQYFGTPVPTVDAVLGHSELWDSVPRGHCRIVRAVLDGNAKLVFFGYSFD